MNNKQKENFFDIIVYSMMIVAVIYVVIQTILGNNGELSFKITLGLWLLMAVIIMDFVEPYVKKTFDKMTSRKAGIYAVYAFCSAAACGCLYVFIINAGYVKEPMHYIFLGISALLFAGKFLFGNMLKDDSQEKSRHYSIEDESEDEVDDDIVDIEINTLSEEDEESIQVKIFQNRNK